MAIESPLFQSAMELLGHSFSHFNDSKELDRKLVILHLANAVELILKDLVLDSGQSIYKGSKETLSIHGCITALQSKGTIIPYLNKLELLIDERNALQHRFGSPNELTAIFYMNIAQAFFKDILKDHYDQDYEELVAQFVDPKELHAFRMREPNDDAELENLKKLANVHPLGALLSAMTYFEKKIIDFNVSIGREDDFRHRPYWSMMSHRSLEQFGIEIPSDLREELDENRRLRNLAAHGRKEPTKDEVSKAIDSIETFEHFLSTLDISEVKLKFEAHLKERELERKQRLVEKKTLSEIVF